MTGPAASLERVSLARYSWVARSFLLVPLILFLATACSTIPPHALAPGDTAAAFQARRIDDEGLKAFARHVGPNYASWPPARLDDEALDIVALYFNTDLAAAIAKWHTAASEVEKAGEIPNPLVNITPQRLFAAAGGIPGWVVASSLVQIIETAGKRGLRVTKARYEAEAAKFEALQVAWDVIASVRRARLEIASADSRLAVLEKQRLVAEASLAIAQKRIVAGLGTQEEAVAATARVRRTMLDIDATHGVRAAAFEALVASLGLPRVAVSDDMLSPAQTASAIDESALSAMRDSALLNRADLLARLSAYAALDSALALEGARRVPDVEIGPAYEYNVGEQKWGLSLSLPLPIFNQNQAAIKVAAAAREQSAKEFEAAQARVLEEISQATSGMMSARAAVLTAERLCETQSAALRAQRKLVEVGEGDQGSVLVTESELLAAQLARADAEADLNKASLAVLLAAQQGSSGILPAQLLFGERS